jgi:hypothetical protein
MNYLVEKVTGLANELPLAYSTNRLDSRYLRPSVGPEFPERSHSGLHLALFAALI